MKHATIIIIFSILVSGCGWVKNLRKEIEDDEVKNQNYSELDYYKDPANRFVPPPPANVRDTRTAVVAGTPIDLSGLRAKKMRVTAAEFFAENAKNENSLWSEEGQNNYLFARNKLRTPGDLITVVIEDRLRKDMVDSVKRILPPEYQDADIKVPGLTKEGSATDRQPATAGNTPATNTNDAAPEDLLTAEVLERYPNGNIRIRGIKRVPFKTQVRNIEVLAIVKAADISEQDVVQSSKFFDQRVELYR